MSIRALLLGILCVLFISGFGYINDHILELESFSNGAQIPIIVIGFLVLGVLIVNPLLKLVCRKHAFRAAELALIVTLASASCGIPGRALMEHFAQIIILPHHWYSVTPGWQTRHMLDFFPKDSLVVNEDNVVANFHIGIDTVQRPEDSLLTKLNRKICQVPWKQWMPPLKTWLPFIFLMPIAMASLALVVHKQWSEHEHLQYPIAEFLSTLIEQDNRGKSLLNVTLSNRMFWIGFIIIFLMRLNNGLCQWYPEEMIPVKLVHSLWPLSGKWPELNRNPWNWGLMRIEIFPLVTAFAFLLSAEISFTLGISQIIWAAFSIIVVGYGYDISTDYDIGGWQGWNRTGSYLAYTLLIFYTGRFYYLNLFKYAFFIKRGRNNDDSDSPAPGAVNAMRIFFISCVALCLLAIKLGLSWPIAIGTILLMLVSFFIVARISAETGLFFIQPGWQPFGSMMTLFGAYAIGPSAIVISALLCAVLSIDQSQALMPYLVNGLKLGEKSDVSPSKLTHATIYSYLIGIVVAIAVVIIACYDFGTPKDHWSYYRLPTIALRAADPAILQLQATDVLEQSEALTGWERILNMNPSSAFIWAFASGFIGVILLSILRLRVRWWPLHPCLFLIWGTFPLCSMSHAILGGWILKKICLKFGGNKLVQALKPLCFGIISAEICGALLFMLIGAIYYFTTGEIPKTYRFFPR